MTPTAPNVLKAEHLASKWLGDANEADERGDRKRAERCYAKAQFWLDRLNKLLGNA
jgi:hypothetical protein